MYSVKYVSTYIPTGYRAETLGESFTNQRYKILKEIPLVGTSCTFLKKLVLVCQEAKEIV